MVRRRSRFEMTAAEYLQTSAEETEVLGTFADYAARLHGISWHIRLAEGQAVEGAPDVRLLIPTCDPRHVGHADYEIKGGDDELRPAQIVALDLIGRVDRLVNGVIRIGRLRPGEMTLAEALARIEEARRW
jgi:hypothetical protein